MPTHVPASGTYLSMQRTKTDARSAPSFFGVKTGNLGKSSSCFFKSTSDAGVSLVLNCNPTTFILR